MEHLIIIGAGGYAKSVLDSVDYYNYKIEGFLDEFSHKKEHLGYPILAHDFSDIPENGDMLPPRIRRSWVFCGFWRFICFLSGE